MTEYNIEGFTDHRMVLGNESLGGQSTILWDCSGVPTKADGDFIHNKIGLIYFQRERHIHSPSPRSSGIAPLITLLFCLFVVCLETMWVKLL